MKYRTLETSYLVEALINDDRFVGWESAKALEVIADTVSATALVETLMDEDVGVRLLDSEALISLKKDAIERHIFPFRVIARFQPAGRR